MITYFSFYIQKRLECFKRWVFYKGKTLNFLNNILKLHEYYDETSILDDILSVAANSNR